jgi:nitrogen regulatory protein P-II 2
MKLIMAFVKPFRLDHVREAMEEVGVDSFSFTEARGIGHHKGERDIYRGVEYAPSFVPMVQIIVMVRAEMAQDLISAIVKAAKSDEPGSGKVMAFDLSDVVFGRRSARERGNTLRHGPPRRNEGDLKCFRQRSDLFW